MSQSVYFYKGNESKKDNNDDYDISERTESVLRKKSEKGVRGLGDCTVCVGAKTHMTMERRY